MFPPMGMPPAGMMPRFGMPPMSGMPRQMIPPFERDRGIVFFCILAISIDQENYYRISTKER